MSLVEILQGTHVALRVLQARLLAVLALIGTFVLFCWAMWLQSYLAAMICTTWGLTIFLPALWAGRGGLDGIQKATQHPEAPP